MPTTKNLGRPTDTDQGIPLNGTPSKINIYIKRNIWAIFYAPI